MCTIWGHINYTSIKLKKQSCYEYPKKSKVTGLRREGEGAKERANGMVGDLHPT